MAITQQEADELELAFLNAFDSRLTEEQQAEPALKAWDRLFSLMERENNYSSKLGRETIDWQIGNWANDTTMVLHNAKRHEEFILTIHVRVVRGRNN